MNTTENISDDFFIGDFTESEKDIAAGHILEKQNAARRAFAGSTAVSVLSVLFVVYLIIGFIASLPELGGYSDPGYVPYSRTLRWDKGDVIVCFLYIPIMVILIGILIAGIANEYKRLSVYNSYKVYKGVISHIEKNYSFKERPLYSIVVMLPDQSEREFDYSLSDDKAAEYEAGTEIILIDFVRCGNVPKAKNYIYESVMTERQKNLRELEAASRLNKYILVNGHYQ